jgi:soluble lytic murein transglycosylase-like protein
VPTSRKRFSGPSSTRNTKQDSGRASSARSAVLRQPSRQHISASPLTAKSLMASLRSLPQTLCMVTIFASFMLWSTAAYADRVSVIAHRASSSLANPFAAFVTEASKRFAVQERWIWAVMHIESAGEVRARSQKGAIGLMQIMPKTWADLRARYGLGVDPYDPHDNILAGAAYIRELRDRYGVPGFLAAYNAGPGRYENHRTTGRPLPDETQAYVAALAPMIGVEQLATKIVVAAKLLTLARSPLFVVRAANNSSYVGPWPGMRPDRPSNVRAVVDLSALVPQSGNLFVHRVSEVRSQ